MKIRVLGAGFYGCHIALALQRAGHSVVVHEIAPHIFAGASGAIPARLHIGCHYPRSRMTRAACLEHHIEFMREYGHLTRPVPVNIYAIAKGNSLVDFAQYTNTLRDEIEFLTVHNPAEFGLQNVEGAIMVGERHIVTDEARAHFESEFAASAMGDVFLNTEPGTIDNKDWDWTIDCTFCANDSAGVDRYEPCLVVLMEGPTNKAVTIMDGPFPSLYPWNEEAGLCSLSSALWTPFSKECRSWVDAHDILRRLTRDEIRTQCESMVASMAAFYPAIMDDYRIANHKLSIRAMPLSGADTRLVDVVKIGKRVLRVRAGKIDAIIHAERTIKDMIQ